MLVALNVKDFAIITSSSLELHSGMTTLTGETGAGKSILLGALGLVLGDRASPGAVREKMNVFCVEWYQKTASLVRLSTAHL